MNQGSGWANPCVKNVDNRNGSGELWQLKSIPSWQWTADSGRLLFLDLRVARADQPPAPGRPHPGGAPAMARAEMRLPGAASDICCMSALDGALRGVVWVLAVSDEAPRGVV